MVKRFNKASPWEAILGRYLGLRLTFWIFALTMVVLYGDRLSVLAGQPQKQLPTATAGEFEVRLLEEIIASSTAGEQTVRPIEVSFPIKFSAGGCEQLYGAAVAAHPPAAQLSDFRIDQPRYLIKFGYDLVNGRCVSRDLSLDLGDKPDNITIQFVKVMVSEASVREEPAQSGLALSFPGENGRQRISARMVSLPPADPFRRATETPRNSSFSFNPAPDALELIITPYDSLHRRILDELNQRTIKCRLYRLCDDVFIATARINDPQVLGAIDEAADAGMHIDVVESPGQRMWPGTGQAKHGLVRTPPWFWLRGNYYWQGGRALLPMHTKFAIFGDDLVISSNSSYVEQYADRSRSVAVVYRDRRAASIFKEMFTMIRTSLFYPIRYNDRDAVQILLNADRPRRYSASSSKAYLEMINADETATSAYGALFQQLKEADEVSIAMSPITNSCARYRRKLCLFDILRDKAEAGRLTLLLNLFFYWPTADGVRDQRSESAAFWSAEGTSKLAVSPQFRFFENIFSRHPEKLSVRTARGYNFSMHHERITRIGRETLVAGSANYSLPHTVNTIEIIRNETLTARLIDEEATWTEPYFVAEVPNDPTRPNVRIGNCEFIPEKDLWRNREVPRLKTFSLKNVLKEVDARYPGTTLNPLELVSPLDAEPASDPARFTFRRLEEATIQSYSSYMCLTNSEHDRFFVVRVKASD